MAECLQLWGGGQGHVNIEWEVGEGVGELRGSCILTGIHQWRTTGSNVTFSRLLEKHYGRQRPARHRWKLQFFFFLFFASSFLCDPTQWIGRVWGFSFYFLTFHLSRIMEVLMLLLEKKKRDSGYVFAWFNAFDLFVYSLPSSLCDFPRLRQC